MTTLTDLNMVRQQARALGWELLWRGEQPGATPLEQETGAAAREALAYGEKQSRVVRNGGGSYQAAFFAGLHGEDRIPVADQVGDQVEDEVDRLSHWPEILASLHLLDGELEKHSACQG